MEALLWVSTPITSTLGRNFYKDVEGIKVEAPNCVGHPCFPFGAKVGNYVFHNKYQWYYCKKNIIATIDFKESL